MHSLTLISTLLAIVALVTSGPIDSSVNTYEAQDGGDDAFLEAYNADPNIDTPSITYDSRFSPSFVKSACAKDASGTMEQIPIYWQPGRNRVQHQR